MYAARKMKEEASEEWRPTMSSPAGRRRGCCVAPRQEAAPDEQICRAPRPVPVLTIGLIFRHRAAEVVRRQVSNTLGLAGS
jgi:hypothetical protein